MKRAHVVLLASAGLGVLILAIGGVHWRSPAAPVASKAKVRSNPRLGFYLPPEVPPPPASESAISKATDEVQIRATYRNFKVALAAGNMRLADALARALRRDRREVQKFAQEELDNSDNPQDRALALRTLETLEK